MTEESKQLWKPEFIWVGSFAKLLEAKQLEVMGKERLLSMEAISLKSCISDSNWR